MEFKKYQSIENAYQDRYIEKWVGYYADLLNETFILTEKIDGANFSIMVEQEEIDYAKRTCKLNIADSFFDYQSAIVLYQEEFKLVQAYMKLNNIKDIRLFGELFGNGIQRRIFYSKHKEIRLFDCEIDGVLLCQFDFIELLKSIGIFHMYVPIIAIVDSLEKALAYNIKFDSKISNKKDNLCEGVVIKQYNSLFKWNDGRVFYLKNKNEKFSEQNKVLKTLFVPTEKFLLAQENYCRYLNENRLQGLISKIGMIEDKSQIGEYIKLMTQDAKEDYLKDSKTEFLALEDKERGKLFSISGRIIMPMLKEYL